MKLNSNGTLADFYERNYGSGLPDSLCPFFWKMVVAVLLLPFNFITLWIREVDGFDHRLFMSLAAWVILGALGCVGFAVYEYPYVLLAMVGVGVGFVVVVGLVAGAYLLVTDTEIGNEITGVIRERKESFKDKYCPRIEWR